MTLDPVSRFIGDETGAGAVEYAVLVCLIAVAIIVSIAAMSGRLAGVFDEVTLEPGLALHSEPTP